MANLTADKLRLLLRPERAISLWLTMASMLLAIGVPGNGGSYGSEDAPKADKFHFNGTVEAEGKAIPNACIYVLGAKLPINEEALRHPEVLVIKKAGFEPKAVIAYPNQYVVIAYGDDALHQIEADAPKELEHGKTVAPDIADRNYSLLVFSQPEQIAVISDVFSPKLKAYVVVTSSPLHGKSDRNGRFSIAGHIPSGHYRITAFHPSYGKTDAEFVVRPGQDSIHIELVFAED